MMFDGRAQLFAAERVALGERRGRGSARDEIIEPIISW